VPFHLPSTIIFLPPNENMMPRAKWWPGFHEGFVQLPKCKDVLMRLEQKIRKGFLRRQTNRRKKRRAGVREFLSLLVLLCTSGCGATFSFRPTVVFTGDSITSNWDASWAGQQTTFAQNRWVDLGVVGITSSQIASLFEADVLDLEPKAAHIVAGTNDVYPGWQLSDTTNNIEAMVKKAKARHIAVVLGTIPPWGPGTLPQRADPSPQRFQRIDQLNQWIIQFGAQQGIQVVDYHSLLAAANGEQYIPALTVDGVHPSPAGYAAMTPHTEQALQTAMAANVP
jgi:lysophospholipase L1-like esterase